MQWRGKIWCEIRGRQKHEDLSLISVSVIPRQGILNVTTANDLTAVHVYVSYRSQHPNIATVQKNIDVSQLTEYKRDHYQQAESSTQRGSTAY